MKKRIKKLKKSRHIHMTTHALERMKYKCDNISDSYIVKDILNNIDNAQYEKHNKNYRVITKKYVYILGKKDGVMVTMFPYNKSLLSERDEKHSWKDCDWKDFIERVESIQKVSDLKYQIRLLKAHLS